MRFYLFVLFFIVSCAARPQGPGLSNAYLPSLPSRSDYNVGGQETQVSGLTYKTDRPVLGTQTTDEPTRGTVSSESVDVIRQTTFIPTTDSPRITTFSVPSAPTGNTQSAIRINIEGQNLPTTQFPQFETNPTTTAASITLNPTFAFSTTPYPTYEPNTNQPITASSAPVFQRPNIPTLPVAPLSEPDQTRITETRFELPKRPPTGSYLPTSDLINNIFQGQSSFGDGSYLGTPGVESSHHGGIAQSHKSVYFYAAPDEDEAQNRLRINIIPSSEANTRVIFIKAPTYPAPIPEVISAPSDTLDKTLIYVLSQKPDTASPISIPVNTIVKPAKPEIFFIKYGSQQEAEQAIANGIQGYPVGQSIQDLSNQQSFVHTIKDVAPNQGGSSGTSGGVKGSGTQTPSKGINVAGGSTSKPSKGSQFGPAGESGPY